MLKDIMVDDVAQRSSIKEVNDWNVRSMKVDSRVSSDGKMSMTKVSDNLIQLRLRVTLFGFFTFRNCSAVMMKKVDMAMTRAHVESKE